MTKSQRPNRRSFLLQLAAGTASASACLAGGWWLGQGSGDARAACLRPPGAQAEDDFLAACIRCGRCADACPNRCVVAFTEEAGKEAGIAPSRGQRGTPVILARQQACMLCQGLPGDALRCTEACPTGALQFTLKDAAAIQAGVQMGLAAVDTHLCYSYNGSSCGVCVRACPFEGTALKAGHRETPVIDPEACVGCGLCERACIRYPTAIRVTPRNA